MYAVEANDREELFCTHMIYFVHDLEKYYITQTIHVWYLREAEYLAYSLRASKTD